MRSIDCCSSRAAGGTGFLAKNALMSAAFSGVQKAPSDPTSVGTLWNTPSRSVSVGHFDFTNDHAMSCDAGCASSRPISVGASCVRTSGEPANSSVRVTSAGSRNQASALKNR